MSASARPSVESDASRGWIGASLSRIEDDAHVRGRGRFLDDLAFPALAHAVFVRSPCARAKLLGIDVERARGSAGVLAVFTAESTASLGALAVNDSVAAVRHFERPLFAADRLSSVGEPVALVVAESVDAAQHAADRIGIDYEPQDALVEMAAAAKGPALFDEWPDNEAFTRHWKQGNVDAAFARAAHVVRAGFTMPRVAPASLEPRATLASFDPQTHLLTMWLGCQMPHRARADLARILGLDPAAVRVVMPDVGGAFGGKASIYPEDALLAFASLRLMRPVKWIATRNEDFVSASHGRGGSATAEAAVDSSGRILAIRAMLEFPVGSWATFSAAVPATNAARILPGPYRVDAVDLTTRGFVTNTAAVGIYRGAGRPEATLLMERLIEEAARATGLDPAEARRRNLLRTRELPRRTPTGQRLDSGDYLRLLGRALDASAYAELRRAQAARRAVGGLFGIGLCMYVEPCGRGWESARISMRPDGRVRLACGTSSQGQGHRTAFAQIAADQLGIPPDAIEVLEGDTERTPAGVGALASRSVAIGGSAIKLAAMKLSALIDEQRVGLSRSGAGELEASVVYTAPHEAWGCGCAVCALSIDADTGQLTIEKVIWIHDAGLVINPQLVEGQLLGGFAQGLGQILCERIHYDADGQLLTGSLMDYALLRADDMPHLELHHMESGTDANALGAKGVGESGCIVTPAVVLNAAIDALRPLGVTDLPIPLTSEVLWRAIRGASAPREDPAS